MKKLLEKQAVFNTTLIFLALMSKSKLLYPLIHRLTSSIAKLNIFLNKPEKADTTEALATTWKSLMPPDGQEYFKVRQIDDRTAITEIHLHCPLRGTGDVHACHKLMNYDRKLMEKVGGQLVVLESQSNSGKSFCRLAIRKSGEDISDLKAAHQ